MVILFSHLMTAPPYVPPSPQTTVFWDDGLGYRRLPGTDCWIAHPSLKGWLPEHLAWKAAGRTSFHIMFMPIVLEVEAIPYYVEVVP